MNVFTESPFALATMFLKEMHVFAGLCVWVCICIYI